MRILELFYRCWSYFEDIGAFFIGIGAISWRLELFCEYWSYFVDIGVILWILELFCEYWSYFLEIGAILLKLKLFCFNKRHYIELILSKMEILNSERFLKRLFCLKVQLFSIIKCYFTKNGDIQ